MDFEDMDCLVDDTSLMEFMERNRESLRRKLMTRRSSEQLIDQGIMPPLDIVPPYFEQAKQEERAKTRDLLKAKIQSRSGRQELVQRHILLDEPAILMSPTLPTDQISSHIYKQHGKIEQKITYNKDPLAQLLASYNESASKTLQFHRYMGPTGAQMDDTQDHADDSYKHMLQKHLETEGIGHWKVNNLKAACKVLKLPVSGTKQELIERIRNACSNERPEKSLSPSSSFASLDVPDSEKKEELITVPKRYFVKLKQDLESERQQNEKLKRELTLALSKQSLDYHSLLSNNQFDTTKSDLSLNFDTTLNKQFHPNLDDEMLGNASVNEFEPLPLSNGTSSDECYNLINHEQSGTITQTHTTINKTHNDGVNNGYPQVLISFETMDELSLSPQLPKDLLNSDKLTLQPANADHGMSIDKDVHNLTQYKQYLGQPRLSSVMAAEVLLQEGLI